MNTPTFKKTRLSCMVLIAVVAGALSACGGGGGGGTATASASETVAAAPVAMPTYHLAPTALDAPSDADVSSHGISAFEAPHETYVPESLKGISTAQLRLDAPNSPLRTIQRLKSTGSTTTVVTYTPAQIRAAYGLPALPTSWTGLSASAAAQYGAGQTIYIVDAYDHPNAAQDLNTFSAKFGLPGCSSVAIASAGPLSAAGSTCTFSKVYANSTGITTAAPAYNSGWATEIAMDIEWAHAIAPLARIVLIEAQDAAVSNLTAAVSLANGFGPGVVSMSFGAAEGSWALSYESQFTGIGMSYFAATGDNGAQVQWPSVSANVTGVGGTTLTYKGTGSRSEVAWSGTGGGASAYFAMPTYQSTVALPGQTGTKKMRGVADVSFNANPYSGQYVLLTPPGGTSSWLSGGGTSIGAPQWAALNAIANAVRANSGLAALGPFNGYLYGKLAPGMTAYSASFRDVTSGTDGTCATCSAKTGYDYLTGVGTPNASTLVSNLAIY